MRGNFKRYASSEAVPTRQMLQHPTQPNLFYPIHRRSMRRTDIDYTASDCLCFVTFRTQSGCGVQFIGDDGQTAWNTLCDELRRSGCVVHAACLMPDHVHLLIAPSGKGESISDVVRRLKSRCCHALRQSGQPHLKWQLSFHDHVLRPSEKAEGEFAAIVAYIRRNPERAGLGSDYPYTL